MRLISNRWYFSLILIPLIINYFTDAFKPNSYSNITLGFITLTAVLIVILIEYYKLYSELRILKRVPRGSDKEIINFLFKTLDIKSFEDEIVNSNAWYGFDKSAFVKTLEFRDETKRVYNQTTDAKLNNLIKHFANSLEDFHEFCGSKVYGSKGNANIFELAKESETLYEKAKEDAIILNKLSDKSYYELKKLLEYVKSNNYLEV